MNSVFYNLFIPNSMKKHGFNKEYFMCLIINQNKSWQQNGVAKLIYIFLRFQIFGTLILYSVR
jgi:hypothetical protein